MNETQLLLNSYFERLYEQLILHQAQILLLIDDLLEQEIDKQPAWRFDTDHLKAYLQACYDFVAERIEMYNPVGMQYLFDQTDTKEAFQLELDLNWYDSREEYRSLVRWVRHHVSGELSQHDIDSLVEEMIDTFGAYPDASIICEYRKSPEKNKLPDYLVACAIEQMIRRANND